MSVKQIIRNAFPRGVKALYREYWGNGNAKKYHVNEGKVQIQLPNSVYPNNVNIENYVRIQDHVRLIAGKGSLVIKKYSAIGSGTLIIPGTHIPTVGLPQYLSYLGINDINVTLVIEEDCWIGAECMLLNKCHIGRGAVVGARSVVTKAIPPYAVVTGTPAKIIAVRFSIDQIMRHEQMLYPATERFSRKKLEEIFTTHYSNMRVIGTDELRDEDFERLRIEKERISMSDFK